MRGVRTALHGHVYELLLGAEVIAPRCPGCCEPVHQRRDNRLVRRCRGRRRVALDVHKARVAEPRRCLPRRERVGGTLRRGTLGCGHAEGACAVGTLCCTLPLFGKAHGIRCCCGAPLCLSAAERRKVPECCCVLPVDDLCVFVGVMKSRRR